jgi:GGDEF domain-containing protein
MDMDKPDVVAPIDKGGNRQQKQQPPARRPRPGPPAKPEKPAPPPPEPRRLGDDAVSVGGLLTVGVTPEVQKALDELAGRLEPLRRELELAKEREKSLQELADRHPFLPVGNRRAFERGLGHVIAHLRHLSPSPALLVLRVAGIEQVRLRHGLGAREAALAHACALIKAELHPTDVLGSLGGDDFGIILLIADADSARARGARIAESIRRTPVQWQGLELPLDAAVGVALLAPGSGVQAALAAADGDLTRARGAAPEADPSAPAAPAG